ncbi:MAG: hypothetical protein IIC02_05695 [Planctomycetes bacterium]|nr:hypothetical protein [Planctomycetota bacterium]
MISTVTVRERTPTSRSGRASPKSRSLTLAVLLGDDNHRLRTAAAMAGIGKWWIQPRLRHWAIQGSNL